ncbi:C69 family dipeptidase [Aminipila luticellarii]|uniref:SLH domain-containing protein n=1 Tax=Aminipila luticellarii TaxID=2507160 RepID=A0A410PXL4_9FIRM|nr:C69 family dipeptidase [Aminipila luticellarii]QAT43615.1 hypothetical protein EQM06_10495 [Aminipila luticellarii]
MKGNYCKKWRKALGGVLSLSLTAALLFTGASTAFACTGVYVGSDYSKSGSVYVGRCEDIGKLYDKVFEVIPAADHADGDLYEDSYGFSMPYPAHTYRYTVMRDSINMDEAVLDEDGNILAVAYGEAGVNENGVAVSATVSTYCNDAVDAADSVDGALCEVSLAQVILMQAKTARDGVEKLAAILDQYGAGECNQISISDKNEVWDFEILSGHQYAAVRLQAGQVAVNPNMLGTIEVDVNDTQNVVASKDLISLPFDKGFLVSSQLTANPDIKCEDIHKIDIGSTYTTKDHGAGQYVRYWQGVNYLNPAQAAAIDVGSKDRQKKDGTYVKGMYIDPVYTPMTFTADRQLSTYDVLRFLAYRGEGTAYDYNEDTKLYGIGNERQAECHIFELRKDMPDALSVVQWQSMSRAEFSVYLPFYSNLITDTSGIYKTEYMPDIDNIEEVLGDKDFPADTSMSWVCAAINDLCDNDRDRYGANVKLFWENYQKKLIEQQEAVDSSMKTIYAYSPALAETKATALGKAVSEEAFGYAKTILAELRAFIAEHGSDSEVFTPSVLSENKLPSYSINMVGGTGIPSSGGGKHHSSSNKSTTPIVKEEKPAVNTGTENGTDKSVSNKFSDVKKNSWFAEAVQFVMDKGIMKGVSGDSFAPNLTTNRAMIVTMLHRLEGEPSATAAGFADVKSGQYYAGAVSWASGNGIVSGMGENSFNPSGDLTREQLACILYRYAQYKNIDVTKSGALNGFSDHAQVSSYANGAIAWAVGNGIINGKDGRLAPQDTTTRAELAVMFQRMNDLLK